LELGETQRIRAALRPEEDAGAPLALAFIHPHADGERALGRVTRSILLGRDPACDVLLDDPSVSRRHAQLERRADALWLRDLGSMNGCRVSRRRVVDAAEVKPGDVLRLGDVLLRLVRRPEGAAAPVAGAASALVGGASLHGVRRLIRLLGPTELRITIRGESGTGKDLAARELHRASGRGGPFIALNCAAIPESLVETELFGHLRGAFTGAARDKPGMFEAAHGGTLFLDEVAELPASTQAKLLRAVETREIRRVGAVRSTPIDTRLISATNHDLGGDVQRGLFRGDLAARLAEAEIVMPPLRERIEDLPALIDFLSQRAGRRPSFDADAMELLACYRWPLNVRELDNLLRTFAVLAEGQEVEAAMLPAHLGPPPPPGPTAPASAADNGAPPRPAPAERILAALRRHRWNVRRASEELGISRSTLYRQLARAGVDVDAARRADSDGGEP
jgi:DNA-binding NtrC family response regulator